MRLPPYHCQYNSIEHVWSQCKRYYDNNIGRDGYGDDKTLAMWNEALEQVTVKQWENYVENAEKLILHDWDKYLKIDCTTNQLPVILNLGEDSESDDDSDSD